MKAFCGQSVESKYFDVMIHTRMQKQSKSRDVVYNLIMSDKTKAIIIKIKDGRWSWNDRTFRFSQHTLDTYTLFDGLT